MNSPNAEGLLFFESRLRTARSVEELESLLVNEPFALMPYEQAFLWKPDVVGRPILAVASGLSEVEANAPFALWFSRAAEHVNKLQGQGSSFLVNDADFPESLDDGAEWVPRHVLVVVLRTPVGAILGGFWFCRQTSFSEAEVELASWIGQVGEFALWAWRREQLALQSRISALAPKHWRRLSRPKKIAVLVLIGAILAFPVQMSVLAPAEVTPLKPIALTAPVDGVVARILVAPNQKVGIGTELVDLEDTATRNRLMVAQKTLDVARADLGRSAGKAFADDSSKADLHLLDSRVRERSAEVTYLTEVLARLKLRAPIEGIALFADTEEWRGKPVQVGERIMTIADPAQVALTIYVSPDDAIALDGGAEVKMYLNISPLVSYAAHIVQASYETGSSPEGHPAYIVKAAFSAGESPPRLGLKGTAKIYAERAPLFYYLLRKPLRTFRHALGV